MNRTTNVFLSYAREDRDEAQRLIHDLRSKGFEPWLDSERIKPMENWEKALLGAIRKSAYFVVLISAHSISQDSYVRKEIKYALSLEGQVQYNHNFVLPVRLQDVGLEGHIGKRQAIDLFPDWNAGIDALYAIMKKDAPAIKKRTLLWHFVGGAAVLFLPGYVYIFHSVLLKDDATVNLWTYLVGGIGILGISTFLSFIAGTLVMSLLRARSRRHAWVLGFLCAVVLYLLFIIIVSVK